MHHDCSLQSYILRGLDAAGAMLLELEVVVFFVDVDVGYAQVLFYDLCSMTITTKFCEVVISASNGKKHITNILRQLRKPPKQQTAPITSRL